MASDDWPPLAIIPMLRFCYWICTLTSKSITTAPDSHQEFQSCNGHVRFYIFLHDSFLIISTGLQCVQRFQLIARGTAQWPAKEAENLGET